MTFRPNRVAVTVRWALLATMLIGTVICVVNAATDDADRPELQALLERYAATGRVGQTDGRPDAKAPGKKVGIPAHESHDGSYVLDQKPDFIFYGRPEHFSFPISARQLTRVGYPSDTDLYKDPRFARDYAFDYIRLPDARLAPVFRRSDDTSTEAP